MISLSHKSCFLLNFINRSSNHLSMIQRHLLHYLIHYNFLEISERKETEETNILQKICTMSEILFVMSVPEIFVLRFDTILPNKIFF